MTTRPVSAVILGTGFAGIAAAIQLRRIGVTDVVILERGDDIGGTWRDNTYPGAACDVPSHLYSLSFEPKADWSHVFSRQPEIREYLLDVVARHDLRRHVRFGAEVSRARFDEVGNRWVVETADGREFTGEVLFSGVGALKDPAYPSIPGLDRFAGPQMHSSRWRPDVDLAGKRVGVIGTGASAIQFVPELAKVAGSVHVFQRTPPWITPRPDRPYTDREKRAFARVPGRRLLHRARLYAQQEALFPAFRGNELFGKLVRSQARGHLEKQVTDPGLREQLSPDYHIGCKRVLVSDDYYPALTQEHVHLVTDPIEEVTENSVRLRGGGEVEVDVLVYGTGFTVSEPLGSMDIIGLDGAKLQQVWGDRPAAYLGVTVPGFPNLYLLLGPNTGLGHNSVVSMIEGSLRHALHLVARLRDRDLAWIDLQPEALQGFLDELAQRHEGLVWASGCRSWYINDDGYNATLWPGTLAEYLWRTRRVDWDDYREVRRYETAAVQ